MRDSLEERIEAVNQVFEGAIQARDTADLSERQHYYRANRWPYKLITHPSGTMHMGLSVDGSFSYNDVWGQAYLIDEVIDTSDQKAIVDIGAGQAATTKKLAKQNPAAQFIAADIGFGSRSKPSKLPGNVHLLGANFEQIPLHDNSAQLVYSIESLCYAENPTIAAKEIARVLDSSGLLVVFDGYSSVPFEEMDALHREASEIVYKGMMVGTQGHFYGDFISSLEEVGFTIEKTEDLSENILPTVRYIGALASAYFLVPKLCRRINKLLPQMVTANAASGYLMPLTIQSGLHTYNMTIARKD